MDTFIDWVDRNTGIGVYKFPPSDTKEVDPKYVFGECYLFTIDETFNQTIKKIKISVAATADKTIVQPT